MRWLHIIPCWIAAFLVIGCWEQPVEERLRLVFAGDGHLKLEVSVKLHQLENSRASEAVERRLSELEDQLLSGLDAWHPRFAELAPLTEDFYWQKVEGRLRFVARQAVLKDPAELADFLADTSIQGVYGVEDGFAELAFYPSVPARANRRERKRMAAAVEAWSGVLAQYFAAVEDLYRYLASQPQRAEACFAHLFDHQELQEAHGPLREEEETLIEVLGERMLEVLEVFEVDAETAHSLQELSSLVYDPFPARVTVTLPGPALGVEGFLPGGEGYRVPGLSLWAALAQVSGEWLAPDPVLAQVEQWQADPEAPFDVPAFAARPRKVSTAPSAKEVHTAIEGWLSPEDVYRLRWQVPEEEEETGKE